MCMEGAPLRHSCGTGVKLVGAGISEAVLTTLCEDASFVGILLEHTASRFAPHTLLGIKAVGFSIAPVVQDCALVKLIALCRRINDG